MLPNQGMASKWRHGEKWDEMDAVEAQQPKVQACGTSELRVHPPHTELETQSKHSRVREREAA